MKLLKEITEETIKQYEIQSEYILENIENLMEERMMRKEKVEVTHYLNGDIIRELLEESNISINENEVVEEIRKEVNDCFKVLSFETNKKGGLKEVSNLSIIENMWSKKKTKLIMEKEYSDEILDIVFEIDSAIKNRTVLKKTLLETGTLPIEFPEIYGIEIKEEYDRYINTTKVELSNIFVFDILELELKFKKVGENKFLFEGKEGSNFPFIANRKLIGEVYGFKTDRMELLIKAEGEYILDEKNMIESAKFNILVEAKDKIKVNYLFSIKEYKEAIKECEEE